MKNASISIYCALILLVLFSFLMTCIEGARIEATKLKFAYAVEAASLSCIAEYQKELFETYDLLFLDAAYGGNYQDLSCMEERLQQVFQENCTRIEENPLVFQKSIFGLKETGVEIKNIQIATDENGEIFKEAAIAYMENKLGITEVEQLKNEFKGYENTGCFSTEIERERIETEELIKEKAVVPVKNEEGESEEEIIWESIEVDNPADQINQTRKGILHFVIEDLETISTNIVNLSSYASQRKNGEGIRIYENKNVVDWGEILFIEYILEKSANYIESEEASYLTYETEYIIAGKESDIENLKTVVNRMLLIRETLNVAHILEDAEKMQELEVLSAGLSAVITLPELQPLIKYSLVLAWGYAEGVSDIKRLLNGDKVAFYKTKEEWKLSLENMLSMSMEEEKEDDEDGVTYKEYLRMLLYLESAKNKTVRMMDLVEMKIRASGYENFRLDLCVNAFEVRFVAKDKNGKLYEKKKIQRY